MRRLLFGIILISSLFCNFFENATIYGSANINTPYIGSGLDLKDDYKYNFGVRKIALFSYKSRSRFYKGNESSISDRALVGAVNGVEYLFSASSVRNRGNKYLDQEYWIKWSNNRFVTKFKYISKESRDLEFVDYEARYRVSFWKIDLTGGLSIKGHPVYGHPAYDDYDNPWWELAYEYGYTDYLVPLHDLNENGEIDDYYVWIETDPITEDGYWMYYYEDADYYWEDPDSNAVAYSDAEFLQYHMPRIVAKYNEDNKEKEWQAEASIALGLDFYSGGDKYYSHFWVNVFPSTVGLTEKSYDGDSIQYDVGTLVGANLSEHIGVFIEGKKLSYYGRREYNVSTGINWRF